MFKWILFVGVDELHTPLLLHCIAEICYSRGPYIDTLSPKVLTLRYDTPLAWHVPLVWPNIRRHVLPSSIIPSCFTSLSIFWALPIISNSIFCWMMPGWDYMLRCSLFILVLFSLADIYSRLLCASLGLGSPFLVCLNSVLLPDVL